MPGAAFVGIRSEFWSVSVATTPEEQAQGLGGLESIPVFGGMLFDFGYDCLPTVTTEPMLFNIDIVFISSGLVVTEVFTDVAPGNIITPTVPARYFMEINAGEIAEEEEEWEVIPGDGVFMAYIQTPPAGVTALALSDTISVAMPLVFIVMAIVIWKKMTE